MQPPTDPGVGDRPGVEVVLVAEAASRLADALLAGGVRLLGATVDPVEALLLVAAAAPQVVVVDVGSSGVAAIERLVEGTAVLAVSADAGHGDVLAAVRAGAAGFLVWTSDADELADAVRRTADGEAVFSPGLADVVLAAQGGPAGDIRLTDRETEVLRLVVEGLTGRQIATRLVLSPRTVENHVQHLLRKLALPNRAALVRHAIENGLA